MIPGNFPIGCLPSYLTTFRANSSFDLNHCLRDYNQFSVYYNLQLKVAIVKLQLENPSVAIVYGDLYFAFQRLFSPAIYPGFFHSLYIYEILFQIIDRYIFDFLVAYI